MMKDVQKQVAVELVKIARSLQGAEPRGRDILKWLDVELQKVAKDLERKFKGGFNVSEDTIWTLLPAFVNVSKADQIETWLDEQKRQASARTASFSTDSDDWYDEMVAEPAPEDSAVQAMVSMATDAKPTRANLEKFIRLNSQIRARVAWKNTLAGFMRAMIFGEYDKEFKNFDGLHSQVSELFSLFSQAAAYWDDM